MVQVNVLSNDLRGKIKKDVPFIKDAFVVFYDDVTIQDVQKAQNAKGTDDITKNLDVVVSQIAEWNFTDNEGKDLPINTDSLTKLPLKLFKWINECESELLSSPAIEEEKKN